MDQVLDHRKVASPGDGTLRPLFRDSTICQGAFGLRVGDNLLPSDKIQTLYPKDCGLKLINGAMSCWHCTWEEGRLPFRSRVQGWGSHVCPLLQHHSPPTSVSGQESDCHKWERGSHLQLIDYLEIWPVPKETKHPITFKGLPRNLSLFEEEGSLMTLTPEKMMLPIHISCLYMANGLTV